MPPYHHLPFDLHGGAFALFLQPPPHAGTVDGASIANGIVTGIILILLGGAFWKRNDQKKSRRLVVGSLSLFCLKLSVLSSNDYNMTADVVIGFIGLFILVIPWWKVNNKYQHRALLLSFSGMFVAFPAYIFGVGSLLVPFIPRVGEGVVFSIILVGALVLIVGMAFLVGRVGRSARTADPKTGAATGV